MKRSLCWSFACLSLAACGGVPPEAQLDSTTPVQEAALGAPLTNADLDYLQQAASYAVLQDELGKIARVRSPSPMVRDYASGIMARAQAEQRFIAELANGRGQIIASSLSVRDRFHIKKLQFLSGSYFDYKYMGYQLAEVDAAQLTAAYATRATRDGDVRGHATEQSQSLAQWLQLARYVDTYRGTAADVPGALGPLPGGKAADPDQGKGPVPDPGTGQFPDQGKGPVGGDGTGQVPGQGQAPEPGKIPAPGQGTYPDPGQVPGQFPDQGDSAGQQGQYPDTGADAGQQGQYPGQTTGAGQGF